MYKNHLRCRACGFGIPEVPQGIKSDSPDRLIPVVDLGIHPLANDFRSEVEEQAGYAPLKVLFCPRCTLAQLSVTVDPRILYSHYSYVTSPSATMRQHFNALYKLLGVEGLESVVEIGSNDGKMLSQWKELNPELTVFGIDPAKNLVELANHHGIPSFCSVFDADAADTAQNITTPDLVIARHVFCHVDDWNGFISNMARMGHVDTRYCIEVPYALDLVKNCEFDTIYHEHLSFLTIRSMLALLRESPLRLTGVEKFSIHGGAILLTMCRKDANEPVGSSVQEFLQGEQDFDIHSWNSCAQVINSRLFQLRDKIETLLKEGKTVAALGASAKSTVWINSAKLSRRHISFICDNTPQKQWKLSPGSGIPIVDEDALIRERPDYVVLFAWNFRDEVLRKFKSFTDAGGKFIIPVPEVEIVPA